MEDITSERRAQEELKLCEERFRIALLHSPVTVFNQDLNLRYTWIQNPPLGYSVEEVLGRTDAELFPPENAEILSAIKRRVIETGMGVREEIRTAKNGKTFYCDLTVEPLRDSNGSVRGITGAIADISDCKQAAAERELLLKEQRRQRQFLEKLLENAPIGIAAVKGPQHRHILANPTYSAIAGLLPQDVVGRTVAEVFPEVAARGATDWLDEIYRTGKTVSVRNCETNAGPQKQQTYWNIDGVPVQSSDGQVEAVLILAQEVSETALSQKRLAFLSEASAVLASSLECETTLANAARLATLTLADWCTVEMLEDSQWVSRVAAAHQDPVKERLAQQLPPRYRLDPQAKIGVPQVLRTGNPEIYPKVTDSLLELAVGDSQQLEILRRLGLKSAMCVPLTARGRTLGAIFFALASSDRRYGPEDLALAEELARRAAVAVDNARLYRSAEEANRMKDEFLAILSHELRTPLSAMFGWVRLLRCSELDEATSARALEAIERNARAQTQLIEDLLDVSRIIRGKLQLNVGPVDLVSVIEAATDTVEQAAETKGIALNLRLEQTVGPIAGDADRLQQVVWNLLSNAIKFTPEGGRVDLRLERVNSAVEIHITDTGKGIGPDFLPFVFERFRQADSSSTRAYSGLGLGLAIVRHLVELHGGSISAFSAGEGQGATFTVRLPVGAVSFADVSFEQVRGPVEGVSPPDSAPLLEGLRVLVVDDEADARELAGTVLEQYGAEVTLAASAIEALEALDRQRADVMVSDIGMPEEDGYSLMRKIRLRSAERGAQEMPAVALTAYAQEKDQQQALSAGFQVHLSKPVDPVGLVAAVARVTGRS
ncbi:hybrid sensor histidine kinase/response regulator [Kamptonema formosum]|uniref:hybrid sensor histidine kinase/response regulator n=1 Tax=Kamptonema formosum TaxID=331992 RepID=UPI00034A409C|nr:ATP-binding protein [Oscillatoria sp. PCC 10802]